MLFIARRSPGVPALRITVPRPLRSGVNVVASLILCPYGHLLPAPVLTPEPDIADCDPLLVGLLKADGASAVETALRGLLEREAAPIIQRVLFRKHAAAVEMEDVESAAREQVIRQLDALRSGDREDPIRDFRGYVASVTYSAWAEYLRGKNPQRSMLLNRLRYLLENRTPRHRFALWENARGEKLCGLPKWITRTETATTPRLQWLLSDPTAAARDAFGGRSWQQFDLATIVTGLFSWLEHPIELRDLAGAVTELLGISDRLEALEFVEEGEAGSASVQSPAEETAWKEYLLWLWNEIARLSQPQRVAFLLPSNVIREFELNGVVSIRTLGPSLEMAPEYLASLWQKLPLDDLTIAKELGCTRQQVINLRRIARDHLGNAWKKFMAESDNKSSRSPSS